MRELRKIAAESLLTLEQLKKIEKTILAHKEYTAETVRNEIDWYCTKLGMAEYYFRTTPPETIAAHIEAVKAAEIMSKVRKDKDLIIDLKTESKDEALYLVDDDHYRAIEVERRIEEKYPLFRIQSYRTSGKASGKEHLRMYLVYKPTINLKRLSPDESELAKIADRVFLNTATPEALQRYQNILDRSKGWETPLIEVTRKEETGEHRIMIIADRDSGTCFFSNISDVLNSYHLVSNRKYIEQFANGKTAYVFYLDELKNKSLLQNIVEDITLVYVIPESPLSDLFRQGKLSAQETVFGVAAWSYAHQFLSGYNEEYIKLAEALKESPERLGILRTLKTKLAKDTFTEAKVWDALIHHPGQLKSLFKLFDIRFNPLSRRRKIEDKLKKVQAEIESIIPTEIDRAIFKAILEFIRVTLRTNFYKREKTSLAFMYSPEFLNSVDYPVIPFGIFHVMGIEFRGFHIRFRDISRGGIRLVRSNTYQNYINNSDFIFDENYNLALTQQKKNKDIPEGGSKGTVLLGWEYQNKAETAFKKYINGLLDLLLTDREIVDYYDREVLLFLGPDEGTADLMEWASLRARVMGYPYWKSFSTGKPIEMGGIPHDLYGMTTTSVHQYILNILEQSGWREEKMTKVMTGGPDGDLGSNEIMISRDRILSIIDGSGVLYDPLGINRGELKRLAGIRETVSEFDKKLLSEQGFLVTVKDRDIVLPDGEKVSNGLEFRNFFHLNPKFKADLFVPCGGRPASININNWTKFIDSKGKPRFKIISEGANLFITQEARLRLEEKGVIVYKDASANKGGVTSSSLEVFASLALTDEEYDRYMCVKGGKEPEFRRRYVEEILELIRDNATFEFKIIEREKARLGMPRVRISDRLSDKINLVADAVFKSQLDQNQQLFHRIIECCCPRILMETVGFDVLLERIPDIYLKAVFASRLASRYVYEKGLEANEIDFYQFINSYETL